MSDFAICELVDRWRQKKRMENLQMRNSQIAIVEIWDTLVGWHLLHFLVYLHDFVAALRLQMRKTKKI
jgi:hypothetical protein